MVSALYVPHRGDIVWIDFDPQAGRQQAGRRPALILSDKEYNRRTSLVLLCPITSQFKPYPFVVTLPAKLLPKESYVLSDQVKSLDWRRRNAGFIVKAPASAVQAVIVFATGIVQGLR